MKKLIFLLLGFVSLILTGNVQARDYWDNNQKHIVVVDIVDDQGRILNQYSAKNNRYRSERSYLEAIKGKRYKLRLRNTSNRRVGVVVAVDGRNILSGKKSYLKSNEKMYLLDPYESMDYAGWRTSKNKINRFYFTSAGGSYANAWGDRSAMGVIAVAVFNEKTKRYDNRRYKRSAPSTRGYLSEESTGTGFGREEHSPTINVSFNAQNRPSLKRFIKYEWRATLCKRGIVDCSYYENEDNYYNNNRFWPREANNGFVPYPPTFQYRQQNAQRQWSDEFTRSWDTAYNRGW